MKYLSLDRKRPNGATLSLCLAAIAHSFLLFSFLPYAGYMAVTLLDNDSNDASGKSSSNKISVDNVGIYAGMLGAAFTLGRFLGFVPWKVLRNALGEKRALVLSLLLTGLASLWVGLSTTFSEAILARFVQGISNCISGSVKRAAINAKHNQESETKALMSDSDRSKSSDSSKSIVNDDYDAKPPEALVLSVMWWGTALGPIVGGLLSDPDFLGSFFGVYPESSAWYRSYPYLLSNVFSAVLCWLSMMCVVMFATDSSPKTGAALVGEKRPLLSRTSLYNGSSIHKPAPIRLWNAFWTLWKTNKDARNHLLAYWFFSFVVVCCDEALPLFLITESTGLGLSEGRVGLLLSVTGLIVAFGHLSALDIVFDTENGTKFCMYRVLGVCSFLGNVPVVLVPLCLLLNDLGSDGTSESSHRSMLLGLTRSSFAYLVVLFALLRGSASLYFSLIGVATGRTLRVVHKDEAARIMTFGALLVRALATIVAGAVLSIFMMLDVSAMRSSWMTWTVIALVFGLLSFSRTFSLSKQPGSEVLPEKQRKYIGFRRSSLSPEIDTLDNSASKSIFDRWKDCISFRLRARGDTKRRSTLVISNDQTQDLPKKFVATWREHTVAPGVDFDSVSFFVIGTHQKDESCVPHVLAPPIMDTLQKHLPTHCAESNFWLKYSLLRDGASTHSIESKTGLARNTILAIETLDGDVFGCFMTKPWKSSNNQYRRCGESFLWKLRERRSTMADKEDEESPELETEGDIIDVYPWTGNNDLCQLFADDKIACGGGVVGDHSDGFGILLENDLLSGSSSSCATYGNPPLCSSSGSNSDQNRFEVANIEIWGLTPFMFVADAERSERNLELMKNNSNGSYGGGGEGESPSSTSAWSQFL